MTSSKIWIKVSPHLAHRSIVFLRWVVLHYLAEITGWTRTQSAAEVTSVLINNEIAAHSVQSSAECLADTQLAHRKNFIWTEHPDRRCLVENTRFSLSRSEVGPKARAPFLGEHSFEVLSNFLAYDANRIADLAALEVLE